MSAAVVERFLAAMRGRDWDAMGKCLADDVVRVGPFGDEYRGRDDYVRFIAALLPTLPNYEMTVRRVVAGDDGCAVSVRLAERVGDTLTEEALLFDLADDHITRIEIFIRRDAP